MVATAQSQQQLMEAGVGVGVESETGVEMMVMDSLDPTLLQMKTEVNKLIHFVLHVKYLFHILGRRLSTLYRHNF